MSDGLLRYLGSYRTLVEIVRPAVVTAILVGLWAALARAKLRGASRVTTWLAAAVPLVAWFAAMWALSAAGAFEPGRSEFPTLALAIVLPPLIGLMALARSARIASALDTAPAAWLVGIQVYRVLGGNFLVLWAFGAIPGEFALSAGIGDVLVGLLALPVAFYIASGGARGRAAAVAWNVFGVTDLLVAVTLGVLTSPGPLQRLALSHPNTAIATYPTVMTPAFAVPLSFILHGLSLWQLRRLSSKGRTGGSARGAGINRDKVTV